MAFPTANNRYDRHAQARMKCKCLIPFERQSKKIFRYLERKAGSVVTGLMGIGARFRNGDTVVRNEVKLICR